MGTEMGEGATKCRSKGWSKVQESEQAARRDSWVGPSVGLIKVRRRRIMTGSCSVGIEGTGEPHCTLQ